jgi:hypothetical protein
LNVGEWKGLDHLDLLSAQKEGFAGDADDEVELLMVATTSSLLVFIVDALVLHR